MRYFFLFLTILFFEKNAVAVVRSSAEISAQVVDNQSVKLADRLEKMHGHHFFLKKTGLAFFKKKNPINQTSPKKDGHLEGGISIIFGLLALCSSILAVLLLSDAFIVAWMVCAASAVIFGVIAIIKKPNRLTAWLGISLSLISLVVGILLAIAYWEGD